MRNRFITVILFTLVGAFILCLGYIGASWDALAQSTRISVATATLGVIGTLFLAVATFWSVSQNRRLIEERIREREKEVVREELNAFIEPSIAIVQSNINVVREAEAREWINKTPNRIYDIRGQTAILKTEVQLVFLPADPYLRERIPAEDPDVVEAIEKHNQMVQQFTQLRQDIIQEIEKPVEDFLQENDYADEFEEDELDVLLDAVVKENEGYRDHEEFWESEQDELIALAYDVAAEPLNEIDQNVDEYLSLCESLQQHLRSRKAQLKEEYGIISEFDSEEDMITAV
ncbi:hypothetical protein [Haloglomus litoreum]|uniref:hypothetical protein n=1 Tax=Haloglomus litoreum TaxID=3034026 RepID=UPI0023E7B71B|nr:hypothetical protein [Haloglomus sp. DT116]